MGREGLGREDLRLIEDAVEFRALFEKLEERLEAPLLASAALIRMKSRSSPPRVGSN
jgi:hypothetical protein